MFWKIVFNFCTQTVRSYFLGILQNVRFSHRGSIAVKKSLKATGLDCSVVEWMLHEAVNGFLGKCHFDLRRVRSMKTNQPNELVLSIKELRWHSVFLIYFGALHEQQVAFPQPKRSLWNSNSFSACCCLLFFLQMVYYVALQSGRHQLLRVTCCLQLQDDGGSRFLWALVGIYQTTVTSQKTTVFTAVTYSTLIKKNTNLIHLICLLFTYLVWCVLVWFTHHYQGLHSSCSWTNTHRCLLSHPIICSHLTREFSVVHYNPFKFVFCGFFLSCLRWLLWEHLKNFHS